jgi:hypothetical protein
MPALFTLTPSLSLRELPHYLTPHLTHSDTLFRYSWYKSS